MRENEKEDVRNVVSLKETKGAERDDNNIEYKIQAHIEIRVFLWVTKKSTLDLLSSPICFIFFSSASLLLSLCAIFEQYQR